MCFVKNTERIKFFLPYHSIRLLSLSQNPVSAHCYTLAFNVIRRISFTLLKYKTIFSVQYHHHHHLHPHPQTYHFWIMMLCYSLAFANLWDEQQQQQYWKGQQNVAFDSWILETETERIVSIQILSCLCFYSVQYMEKIQQEKSFIPRFCYSNCWCLVVLVYTSCSAIHIGINDFHHIKHIEPDIVIAHNANGKVCCVVIPFASSNIPPPQPALTFNPTTQPL